MLQRVSHIAYSAFHASTVVAEQNKQQDIARNRILLHQPQTFLYRDMHEIGLVHGEHRKQLHKSWEYVSMYL